MDTQATIKQLSVHYTGNKGLGQEFVQAAHPLELNDRDKHIIAEAFLAKFSTDMERYSFTNAVSLDYNVVFTYAWPFLLKTQNFIKAL